MINEKFKLISIDGKQVDEGAVIIKWFNNRFGLNKNVLIGIIGETGSGKSYVSLRICELWYQHKFNEQFPIQNVCFSIEEAAKLLDSGKLRKGEIIIIEEVGVIANALDFQNKVVKLFGAVMQSFRSLNIGMILNTPNFSFMGKTQRGLLHAIFETTEIDRNTQKAIIKPFYLQTNSYYGKNYRKYFRQRVENRIIKIQRMSFSKPSSELSEIYEEKKSTFVKKTIKGLAEVSDTEQKKERHMELTEEFIERVKKLKSEGNNMLDIMKILHTNHKVLRRVFDELYKREYETKNEQNSKKT